MTIRLTDDLSSISGSDSDNEVQDSIPHHGSPLLTFTIDGITYAIYKVLITNSKVCIINAIS